MHLSDKIRTDLVLPEAEDTWERITKALVGLKQSLDGDEEGDVTSIVQSIRSFQSPITSAMVSERTRLCLAALDLVDAVAVRCEVKFEPLVTVFLPALLSLCGRTNKVIVNRTRTCITNLIESTQLATVLPYFLQQLGEKSGSIRLIAVQGALACVKCCNPPDLEKESRATDIENIIRKASRDASAEVRKVGRELFTNYKILLPDRVDRFTAPLTPTIKKYLDIKSGNTSKQPLPSMKSTASRLDTKPKLPSSLSRTNPVTASTSTSVVTRDAHRVAAPARSAAVVSKPPSQVQPSRPIPSTSTRADQPKKLVSQAGAAGPSRVVSRPTSTEPPRATIRLQRTMPTIAQRSLARPPITSTQSSNSSGPRRVPLPPSSSSTNSVVKVAEKPLLTRPNSQQSRRVPTKTVERPVVDTAASTSRIGRPEPKVVVPVRSKTPVERTVKLRTGLSQPTLSQMAKMKTNVARKAPMVPTAKVAPPPIKAAVKTKPKSTNVSSEVASKPSVVEEVVEALPERQEVVVKVEEVEVELVPQVEEAEEGEHVVDVPAVAVVPQGAEGGEQDGEEDMELELAEQQPLPLPTITEPEELLESESSPRQPEFVLQGMEEEDEEEDEEEEELHDHPDEPFTPAPQSHLGVAWNVNDAKTPISALLSSIQQGFEFSPASPLSPPQGYHNIHLTEAMPLF